MLACKWILDHTTIMSRSTAQKDMVSLDETHERGHRLLFEGHYDQAITCFDRVLELKPKHMDACMFKGQALLLRGRPSHSPSNTGTATSKATAASESNVSWHLSEHNAPGAQQALEVGFMPLFDVDQEDAEGYLWAGIACIDCGKYDQAAEMLEEAETLAAKQYPISPYQSSVNAHKHRLNAHKYLYDVSSREKRECKDDSASATRNQKPYKASLEELDKGLMAPDLNGEDRQFLHYDKACVLALTNNFAQSLKAFNYVKSEMGKFTRTNFKNVDHWMRIVANIENGGP